MSALWWWSSTYSDSKSPQRSELEILLGHSVQTRKARKLVGAQSRLSGVTHTYQPALAMLCSQYLVTAKHTLPVYEAHRNLARLLLSLICTPVCPRINKWLNKQMLAMWRPSMLPIEVVHFEI